MKLNILMVECFFTYMTTPDYSGQWRVEDSASLSGLALCKWPRANQVKHHAISIEDKPVT